jgi:hypothetical protein
VSTVLRVLKDWELLLLKKHRLHTKAELRGTEEGHNEVRTGWSELQKKKIKQLQTVRTTEHISYPH